MSGLRALIALFFVIAVAMAPPVRAAAVTVYAAASLKEAMDEQARAFEVRTGNTVTAVYGASSALAKQIEAGAPADVFISADLGWLDYVDQRQLLARGTRVDLLHNALVLVAPKSSGVMLAIAPGFALAAALGGGKLAMANPDSVPAGKYGRAALQTLGVWTDVERQVARAENVRGALVLVARGEAPLGIVYRTDALAEPGVRVVASFPASTHPPIIYPAAVTAASTTPAAKMLLDALRSPSAAPVWQKHGFGVVQ